MTTLASEYYQLLKDIQDNKETLLTRIPSDAYVIDIDLNSREILVPQEQVDFLSVERDHRAETWYFRVDRFYDGVDLSKTTIVVEYVNALGEGRIYPTTIKDILSQDGKIIFEWSIGREATKKAGILRFAVRFYSVALDEPKFTYSLNTLPKEGNIVFGMEEVDADEEFDWASNQLQQMIGEINSLKNAAVYWQDV